MLTCAALVGACGSGGSDEPPRLLGAAALSEPTAFRCGGRPVNAVPTDEGLALLLILPGRTLMLLPVLSPTGARYAGDAGTFGVEDDGTVWLQLHGSERVACEPDEYNGARNGAGGR